MAIPATSTYPPTLEALAPVARALVEGHVVVHDLEQEQSMPRARLGEHA